MSVRFEELNGILPYDETCKREDDWHKFDVESIDYQTENAIKVNIIDPIRTFIFLPKSQIRVDFHDNIIYISDWLLRKLDV